MGWIKSYTLVDGETETGIYAPDGSVNVVDSGEEDGVVGIYHPCGAYWVTFTNQLDHPAYAPNGSYYLYVEPEPED